MDSGNNRLSRGLDIGVTAVRRQGWRVSAACWMAAAASVPAMGQTGSYVETMEATSTYTRQDCLGPCACVSPARTGPLTGVMRMVFDHQDQFTQYYTVTGVDLTASTPVEAPFHYTGTGTYEIGGDFAYTHRLVLDLAPSNASTPTVHHFDSGYLLVPSGGRPFPAISITVRTSIVACTQRTLLVQTRAGASCAADIVGIGGLPPGDGQLTGDDFVAFINAFAAGDLLADITGIGGPPAGPDGLVTGDDFNAFIAAFASGCP